jgi:TrmH family RNA methyltransferase
VTAHERPDGRTITSPSSDRVRKIAALSGRSARRKQGLFRADGPQTVRSLLRRRPDLVRDVYMTHVGDGAHPELVELATDARVHLHEVADDVLRAMTRGENGVGTGPRDGSVQSGEGVVTPQGVVAVGRIEDRPVGPALDALPEGPSTVLVLVGVQDPGNVGTLIRSADAAGCDLVLLTAGSADVFAPKTLRASVGSVFHLPVVPGVDPEGLMDLLDSHRLSALATSGHARTDLFDAQLPERAAWLMGNEAHGLPDTLLAAADLSVRIPLAGHAESLNVQAAATVCLFETLRRRRTTSR